MIPIRQSKKKLAQIHVMDPQKDKQDINDHNKDMESFQITSKQSSQTKSMKKQILSDLNLTQIDSQATASMSQKTKLIPKNQSQQITSLGSPKIRADKYGVPIFKGSKKHKITFNTKLEIVYQVENWKINNVYTEEDDTCNCPCNLF